MGDAIANWMWQAMPGFIRFVGNLGETGTIVFTIALIVAIFGMYKLILLMLDDAMNRTYHPKKHHKTAKKHNHKENVKKFIEYVKTADDEPYDESWMDYEKYIRTK